MAGRLRPTCNGYPRSQAPNRNVDATVFDQGRQGRPQRLETPRRQEYAHYRFPGLIYGTWSEPAVERIRPIRGNGASRIDPAEWRLAARSGPGHRTEVHAGKVSVGGESFAMIAGPCAVESEAQLNEAAEVVARAGVRILRGGAFKPRTSPYEFQGLGAAGLRLLRKVADRFDLAVVTEVMSDSDVGLVAEYADILQIGSRSIENYALLHAASGSRRPLLLKRGMTATIEEYLDAAEFVLGNGNPDVILCERGIRTFGTATRNTCDLAAVALLHEITHLPVIVDPSHATGMRSLVPAVSKAAVAIGADGLLVEVHPCPERALSDGPQSLTLEQFDEMMRALQPHLEIWARERAAQMADAAALVTAAGAR